MSCWRRSAVKTECAAGVPCMGLLGCRGKTAVSRPFSDVRESNPSLNGYVTLPSRTCNDIPRQGTIERSDSARSTPTFRRAGLFLRHHHSLPAPTAGAVFLENNVAVIDRFCGRAPEDASSLVQVWLVHRGIGLLNRRLQ